MALGFGFKKDNAVLASKFSHGLHKMDEDFSLGELQGVYIFNEGIARPVKFDRFDRADMVKVAVTGEVYDYEKVSDLKKRLKAY